MDPGSAGSNRGHLGADFLTRGIRDLPQGKLEMYKATKSEQKILIHEFGYNSEVIKVLDAESEKVRRGILVDLPVGILVCEFQSALQAIRKSRKTWWKFWR